MHLLRTSLPSTKRLIYHRFHLFARGFDSRRLHHFVCKFNYVCDSLRLSQNSRPREKTPMDSWRLGRFPAAGQAASQRQYVWDCQENLEADQGVSERLAFPMRDQRAVPVRSRRCRSSFTAAVGAELTATSR